MCEPPITEGLNCRQPVVKTPGTCRDSFDILAELAERLGKIDIMNGINAFICGLVHDPDLMLDVTKRYTHKEFLDQCGRYWTKHVWPKRRREEHRVVHGKRPQHDRPSAGA